MEHAREAGSLARDSGQDVYLSTSESQAWKVAHRLNQDPVVLVVEARRAERDGVAFRRGRGGLFLTQSVPSRHVLNLGDGFGEQLSAGGFLVRRWEGEVQVALVSCRRGRRDSWEIAKGKLEEGETPQESAKREIQEEMGFTARLEIVHDLGVAHYAFHVPGVGPRLKRLHVYVLVADPEPVTFEPRAEEGIQEVRWFPVDQAQRLVPHPSLRPVLTRLVNLYKKDARNGR
jgi:8-oxo-dGTP pyrophosphatase MutT (NUDIX family)